MKLREHAARKSGAGARNKRLAMASAAPKRMAPAKKSAPKKKKPALVKKTTSPSPKKPIAAMPKPVPTASRPAPSASNGGAAAQAARPSAPPVRPAASGAVSVDEKRRAATRKFFARLRSLEAIVGADLRKRGSLVLMQAVDQWYSEAISATATDVSITNAAKAVITHL